MIKASEVTAREVFSPEGCFTPRRFAGDDVPKLLSAQSKVLEGKVSDLQSLILPRFGGYLLADQVELLFIVLSSLPQEVFEKGFYGVEDAFGGQKNGALVNRDAGED